MRTVAGHIRISDQQAQEVKRHHEQRDADEREMWDELAASYLRTHKGLDTQTPKATTDSEPNPMPVIAPPGVIAVGCRSKSALARLPHNAKIETHNGWWFRYTVHRTAGIGIPGNSYSLHRTLKGAERAVRRWKAREYTPTVVNDPTTDWTVLPRDIAVAALPEINALAITGNPIIAVASWDGQAGLVEELEERAASIDAHTVALSKPRVRMIPEYRVGQQTYCYAAFASDTPYTVDEVTREFVSA